MDYLEKTIGHEPTNGDKNCVRKVPGFYRVFPTIQPGNLYMLEPCANYNNALKLVPYLDGVPEANGYFPVGAP